MRSQVVTLSAAQGPAGLDPVDGCNCEGLLVRVRRVTSQREERTLVQMYLGNHLSSGIFLPKSVNCVLKTALVGKIPMVAPAAEGITPARQRRPSCGRGLAAEFV